MYKYLFSIVLLIFSFNCLSDPIRDSYAKDSGTYLDERDHGTLRRLNKLDSNSRSGHAVAPGAVRFTYGDAIPTVVCAILELTDIELEVNETISSVQLGDGARWYVDVVKSGNENNLTEHLIVKPLDAGLKTSLIVTTDRRTYHIRLKSTADDFMQSVHFYYPRANFKEDIRSNYNYQESESFNYNLTNKDKPYFNKTSYIQGAPAASNKKTPTNKTLDLKNVNSFIYTVKGDISNSINAYYNGTHSVIEVRDPSLFEDAPVFFTLAKDGDFNDSKSPVNYTLYDNKYLVEGGFSKLLMQFTKGGADYSVNIVR